MNSHLPKDPNKVISTLIQANNYRLAGEYRKALHIYQELIGNLGETSEIDQLIAGCYYQLGLYGNDEDNYIEAVIWIEKAIILSPMNSQLYDILGEIHSIGTLNYEASIKAYRTAIDLNPNNVHALVNGAGLYGVPEEVISMEEAINWLEQAVQVEPDNASIHFNLGMRYYEGGQISKAKKEWERALSCPLPLEAVLSRTIRKLLSDT
jgi:tetratricopeptide (TPR) repeat protein